jgi:hypothetical protein
MALPKIEVPTYDLELPISKKEIKFRPFLVREQKILLMAMESKDPKTIQNAVGDILKTCVTTPGFDLDSLPIVDVEFIFLNLRAKSVSEVVETKYRCNNEVTTAEGTQPCGGLIESKIDLTQIQPETDTVVDPIIKLDGKITVKMKHPTYSSIKDSSTAGDISRMTLEIVANCIEYIYDGEQYYYGHETPIAETVDFLEGLNQPQFEMIENYFNNMPRLKKKITVKCKKCGYVHDFELEGIQSFFE